MYKATTCTACKIDVCTRVMPLVLISGLPCSGKSQAAAQLAALLTGAGQNVIIIDEESQQLTRNESYKGCRPPPAPLQRRFTGTSGAANESLMMPECASARK